MKKMIATALLGLGLTSYSQQLPSRFTMDDFEKQVLAFEPKKNKDVSDKDYGYGKMILKETKEAVRNKPENFNLADYFNVLSALASLKEPKETLDIAFRKFSAAEGSCEYILSFESTVKNNLKYDAIREAYDQELTKCKEDTAVEKSFDLSAYATSNHLDPSLVERIYNVHLKDQRYRNTDSTKKISSKQHLLDKENQVTVDSLYRVHTAYVGKNRVGKKFESVMWAVIQHSNVEMMERYLPVVKKAVLDKELEVAPLKMLIDRFYGLKYGYQIFGSQGDGFGFKTADEKTIKEVKLEYGIE